jgi:hypothetical protein
VLPPPGVTVVAVGEAEEVPLRTLDRVIRDEVEATVGWQEMPAEVLPCPDGPTLLDPSKYAVAAQSDQYVGLVRVYDPRSTTQLAAISGLPIGAVGNHLKVMLGAGVVLRRRSGREVLYWRTALGDSLVATTHEPA